MRWEGLNHLNIHIDIEKQNLIFLYCGIYSLISMGRLTCSRTSVMVHFEVDLLRFSSSKKKWCAARNFMNTGNVVE